MFKAEVVKGSKRFWRVVIVDAAGKEIDHAETYETKRLAVALAAEINGNGKWITGVSGFRYYRNLSDGSRV